MERRKVKRKTRKKWKEESKMERRENKEYEDYEGNDMMKRRNKNGRKTKAE